MFLMFSGFHCTIQGYTAWMDILFGRLVLRMQASYNGPIQLSQVMGRRGTQVYVESLIRDPVGIVSTRDPSNDRNAFILGQILLAMI